MNLQLRDFALREIGCVVARLRGVGFIPCTKHHLLTTGRHGTGKRRGERFTVGLSDWSHQGRLLPGWSEERCREVLGPSYAKEPRAFRELYPDDLLLAEQERLLADWESTTV